jgi:hypothetical protein
MRPRVSLALPFASVLALCLGASLALSPAARADHHEKADPHAGHAAPAAATGQPIPRTPRPADAKLYIISPKSGETVSSPVTVRFGLMGMGVAPAGVATPATGHHHLVIDAPLPPMDAPLPKDDKHVHFGGGQTEVTLELPPGAHTIQLVLADKDHVPHDPPLVSDPVAFTVR